MNAADCTRYMAARDRELLEETLSELDRWFCQRHEQSCPACAEEAAVWSAVTSSLRESVGACSTAPVAPRSMPASPPPAARSKKSVPWPLVASAAAACLLIVGAFTLPGPIASSAAFARVVRGTVSAGGQSHATGAALGEASSVRALGGPACIMVPEAVELCLSDGSQLSLQDLHSAARSVHLAGGRVTASLAKQPVGTTFSVVTAQGSVTAIGTVFSVEIGAGSRALVRVDEGSVEVRAAGAPLMRVRASESLELGQRALLPQSTPAVEPAPRFEPSPRPDVAEPDQTAPVPRVASASEQLTRARARRASGDARGAAQLYRALQQLHPNSSEAHASYVSLGQLELLELGNPAAALVMFETYLKRRAAGALSEEARHGRIRALYALGRTAEARIASEQFLKAHPKSPHAAALRGKLASGP
jgi:hypothetical protein